jgi:NADH dehydrogenase
MKIAVTGAFSYSGKYITKRLLERGEEVITLTNHPDRDPFNGKVKAYPLDFDEAGMTKSLQGVEVLVNTYWVRFDKGENTQPRAVENTGRLVKAAKAAGVRRIVHISIANPSANSPLPYYWGKAANEKAVTESGLSYTILRPTVLIGMGEDILINNIAYLLRRLPVFFIPGSGSYGIQPIYIEDLADLAVEGVYSKEDYIIDAVGPDTYAFKDLVKLIGQKIGAERPLISIPPRLALLAAQFLSFFVRDVILTPEEVDGLMANLLVSKEPPRAKTAFKDWLEANKNLVGMKYASELERHY